MRVSSTDRLACRCICGNTVLGDAIECPSCQALRRRGAYHPDPEIDAEIQAELAEARAVDARCGLVEGWHRGLKERS
jgi:hypothetical protein